MRRKKYANPELMIYRYDSDVVLSSGSIGEIDPGKDDIFDRETI